MARVKRELMTQISKRQLGFFGHVLRVGGLQRDFLLGMVEGRTARGKQRMKYKDGIR